MRLVLLVVLLLGLELSRAEPRVLDKCEINHNRCLFTCKIKFPVERDKYKGCKTRCKLEAGLCKTKEALRGVKDFWTGFKMGKE
jgi:hypothetical protein